MMKLLKYIIGLFLGLNITINAFSDGGPGYTSQFSFYERELNLFYSSVQGKVKVQLENGKYKNFDATSNIEIYDISKKSSKSIFDSLTFNESVVSVYFEQYYDSSKTKIIFNQTDYVYGDNEQIQNNFNINKRDISKNLIIETYSFKTETYSLWVCGKNGENLRKVFELKGKTTYHIDSFNKCIRILTRLDKKNEIIEIEY